MFHRHPLLSLLTFCYLGFIGWMTLTPQSAQGTSLLTRIANRVVRELGSHERTAWLTFEQIEFAANVAMFVPVGVFFLLLMGRNQWWLAIGLGVALTIGIEVAQQQIPGRFSDPRDVLANGSGTAVGVVVGWILSIGEVFRRRR